MPHSDFLTWLTSATLRFFNLAKQCNTQIFKVCWAVPHSDLLAWLSSATLMNFYMTKNENTDSKNEDELKNEDNLKNDDDLKMKMI